MWGAMSTKASKRMGRPPGTGEQSALVHVRLRQDLLDDIDAEILGRLGQDRSYVIRELLDEALQARKAARESGKK